MLSPQTPSYDQILSNAEKILLEAAEASDWFQDDKRFLLHSLRDVTTENGLVGEVDFVYLDASCLLFLEAKAGEIRYDSHKNQWYSGPNSIKDPFEQVTNYLFHFWKNLLPRKFEGRLALGYGVLFPEAELPRVPQFKKNHPYFQQFSMEVYPRLMYTFGSHNRKEGLKRYIVDLREYWQQHPSFLRNQSGEKLSPKELREIRDLFRRDLHMKVPLLKIAQDNDTQVKHYTTEQLKWLDMLRANPMMGAFLIGGPGTGKTVLALEQAQRKAAEGQKVLLLCYNKVLRAHLRKQVASLGLEEQVDVYNVHDFFVSQLGEIGQAPSDEDFGKGQAFWMEDLPGRFRQAFQQQRNWHYDYLIVDEAQDILCNAIMDALELILPQGWEAGSFLFLLDDTYQKFYGHFDRDFYQLFKETYRGYFFELPLSENCRNPQNIMEAAAEYTGLAPMKCRLPAGPTNVAWEQYQSEEDLKNQVTARLGKLREEGIGPQSVSILTFRNHTAENLAQWLPDAFVLNDQNLEQANENTPVSTMHRYKGLDNNFVLLVGLDTQKALDEAYRSLLFVAFTRAKTQLMVFAR